MIEVPIKYSKSLKDYTFIDLFAGIGGFHLALSSFGAKCVFASEMDKHASAVYKKNYGIQPHGDITLIDESKIPKHDILAAGFPCQPFSIAGKKGGFNDIRGTLFFDIVRIVKYHQPSLIVLENVANIVSHDKGNTILTIQRNLTDLGYHVDFAILKAQDYGIPQNRKRMYLLASKNKLTSPFPKKEKLAVSLKEYLETDVPDKYILNIKDEIKYFDLSTEKDKNTPHKIAEFSKGRQGERIYSIDSIAITLSAQGGGIGGKTGIYKVNNIFRKLTPRECANIMGYPKSFEPDTSDAQAYKQFGNSLVVDLIQKIILNLVKGGCL